MSFTLNILFYIQSSKLTEQSQSKANSDLGSQEFLRNLLNSKFIIVFTQPPHDQILSHTNHVHILTPSLFNSLKHEFYYK
jgi:hypothetical protein